MKEKMEKFNNLFEEATNYENSNCFWEASEKYQLAILELNKHNGFIKKKAFCKKKIVEMNNKRAKDFKEISVEHNFTQKQKEQIKSFINSFIKIKNVTKILDKIGRELIFHPKFNDIQNNSQKNMPVSFLFCSLSVQDDQGNLLRSGHDANALSFIQNYEITQGLILQCYLLPIFQKLMESKLNTQSLFDYFKSKNFFSEDLLKKLKVAIERFFLQDYVSALHIITPIFEKAFLEITALIDEKIDTIGARNQINTADKLWTQDRILGEDFLKRDDIKKIWGEDFCEQINFVFLSPLGYKLRHKVAHGYIKSSELNFMSFSLVLYFFLVLVAKVEI